MTLKLRKHNYPGKLIVFTGVDGSGKTTLLECAEFFLREQGCPTYKTKMPSDRIRTMKEFRNFHDSFDAIERKAISPLALTVLVSGDRLVSLEEEVIPYLEKGYWVLLDRYQFTGLTICEDSIIQMITNQFIEPDAVFLASVPLDMAEKRVKSRPEERNRFYDVEQVKNADGIFKSLASSNSYFHSIDTSGDKQQAFEHVKPILEKLLI